MTFFKLYIFAYMEGNLRGLELKIASFFFLTDTVI